MNSFAKKIAIFFTLAINFSILFSEEIFKIEESALPQEASWQCELTFPDRKEEIDDSLALNNLYAFDFFHGQGELYIQVGNAVQSLSIFINKENVNAANFKAGKTYKIDFSKVARDGKNIFQAATIKSKNKNDGIKVFIPYPVLLDGSLSKSGIDQDALNLISEIIQSDIEHGFPSAQLALAKNGRLVYKKSWGFLNSYDMDGNPLPPEKRKKVSDDSLFDLASCTKALAANFAVQNLVSKKKLSLDQKVSDILGQDFYKKTINIKYKKGSGASLGKIKKWKETITIRDLACHRAGFPAGPAYYNQNFNSTTQGREKENQIPKNKLFAGFGADEETRQKTYEAICKTPLLYEPRTKVLYSDVDYMILCFVVEKISGQSFDEFCETKFWKPMGLERIAFNPLKKGFEKEDCAATELRGNTRDGTLLDFAGREDTIQGEVHDEMAYYSMAGVSGHAGLFSNAVEAVKLLSTLFYGGWGTNKFFTKDALDVFFAPQSPDRANWGIGWYREGDDRRSWNFSQCVSRNAIGHNGWTGTLVMLEPEEKIALAYFTSKRNSPYHEKNAYNFDGSYFTAANYGIVPQLIMEGAQSGTSAKRSLLLLLEDMVHDKFRLLAEEKVEGGPVTDSGHPLVQAAYSLLEVFVRRAAAYGSEEALSLARNSINYLSPKRDGEEIKKIRGMIK